MARQFSEYTGQFFWSFKRMDNVNYNYRIIESLYFAKKQKNDLILNKPIIILIMGIIECMLYDFTHRIHTRRNDPFPNMTMHIINYFRKANHTDELKRIIPLVRSQNLLREPGGIKIYDDLEHLRNVRNRIHIQNRYSVLDEDECNVFTETNLKKAEYCLERVCDVLCNVYPRWNKTPLPMSDFPRPWL